MKTFARALCLFSLLSCALWAQADWSYTPTAFPAVCTNPAVVGQWTMDYETATELALAENRNIYLLVTGSTWCPDCDKLQQKVMATPELKDFMANSDAYWIWLDQPYRPATNATQYGWLCHPDAGYFTAAEAEAILARNREIEYQYGMIKGYRTFGTLNMPTFVACHPDGSYQGELTYYNKWEDVNAEVFLAQLARIWNDDEWDVQDNLIPGKSDDERDTATLIQDFTAFPQEQLHSLSPTDHEDWYTFVAMPGNIYQFAATGQTPQPATQQRYALSTGDNLTIQLFLEGSDEAEVTTSGPLGASNEISWTCNLASSIKCYVRVSGSFDQTENYTFAYSHIITAQKVTQATGAAIESGETDIEKVAGVVTASVSKKGRVSVQFRHGKGTVRFAGRNFWDTLDESGRVCSTLHKNGYDLTLGVSEEGKLQAEINHSSYNTPLVAELTESPWSKTNLATDYEGYYTVAFTPEETPDAVAPQGHSYMTVTVSRSGTRTGRVTYAGKLANGVAYSGSTTLYPLQDGTAQMVMFATKSSHALSGLLAIKPNAAEIEFNKTSVFATCGCVMPFWSYQNKIPELSFDVPLSVTGVYYNKANRLLDYYELFTGEGQLHLFATGEYPTSPVYGSATELPILPLTLGTRTLRIEKGAPNPTRAKLSFNRRTGIFKGSFSLPFQLTADAKPKRVTAKFQGVLLPGWVADGGCDMGCGDYVPEEAIRPFGMGSFYYTDRIGVNDRLYQHLPTQPIVIDYLVDQ